MHRNSICRNHSTINAIVRGATITARIPATPKLGRCRHAANVGTPELLRIGRRIRCRECTHFGDEYYGLVEARIRRAAPDDTLWQATVYPPSTQGGEWGIRATRVGDDYELTIVQLDRSLWGTGWAKAGRNEFKRDLSSSPARPRATTHKISARLLTELESALRRMIEAARVPDETSLADALNLHGVLFRF